MKILFKILINIISLIILSGFSAYAQTLPVACGGDVVRYRVVGDNGYSTFQWSINSGGTVETVYNNGDSVDIRWTNLDGPRIITVIETSIYGCEGEPYWQEQLISAPTVDIGLDAQICFGESYDFVAIGSVNNFLWQDGVTTEETFVATIEGDYWVRVTDTEGCTATDSAYLTVNPLPVVDLGNDTTLCDADDIIILDAYNTDIDFYEWYQYTNDDPNSEYLTGSSTYDVETESKTRHIWVSVQDLNGCIGSDTITVAFCGDFVIPNAFSPNDDPYNPAWTIEYLEAFPDVTVDVYNRFGDRVFSSVGYETAWDGTDTKGRELPMDTYYYVIDFHNGEAPKVGSVTIIR